MQSTLKSKIITIILSILMAFTSCCRKDLFLRVDQTQIKVDITDIRLNLLWGIDWETKWFYDWDESDLGIIGYSMPELIKGTIYNVDTRDHRRFSSFFKIFEPSGGRVSLTAGSTYDMMFYNFGTEYTSFYQSEDYESLTASTRMSSQSSWIRTKAESESSEMPDTIRSYTNYNQPDELFGTLVTDITVNEDPTLYDKEVDEEGHVTYIYRINASLKPYSFIYLYQVVILNNRDQQGSRITGGRGITITGLAQGVEMFTRKTFNNTIAITTDDIKPMQNRRLTLDGQERDADVLATRILTWGLPGINPLEMTKSGTRAVDLDRNFIGISFSLRNGYGYNVTLDITEEMHKNPTGGIITVFFDAGRIPEEVINQKPQSTGGGFNANVQDWANEINAEVTI